MSPRYLGCARRPSCAASRAIPRDESQESRGRAAADLPPTPGPTTTRFEQGDPRVDHRVCYTPRAGQARHRCRSRRPTAGWSPSRPGPQHDPRAGSPGFRAGSALNAGFRHSSMPATGAAAAAKMEDVHLEAGRHQGEAREERNRLMAGKVQRSRKARRSRSTTASCALPDNPIIAFHRGRRHRARHLARGRSGSSTPARGAGLPRPERRFAWGGDVTRAK